MIKKQQLFVIFLRSFFIQAVWNFERLQNIGFAYGLLPFFRKLYRDPEKRKDVLLRHIDFFNTHPYMVNIILGMVASLEKDMAENNNIKKEEIIVLKTNMAGPLAAIGDTFFWATWRPFTVLLSIGLTLFFFKFKDFSMAWLVPVIFLFIYNSIHIPFRYWSLNVSSSLKMQMVEVISELKFQKSVDIVRVSGFIILLLIAAFYFWSFASGIENKLLFMGVFIGGIIIGCLRVSANKLVYIIVLLSIIIVLLRGY